MDLHSTDVATPVPYVLRAATNGYRFVGETYLHGFMDGKGVGGTLRGVNLI
jgi:hypothetical protein